MTRWKRDNQMPDANDARQLDAQRKRSSRREERVLQLEEAMFAGSSRHLLLVLTLSYGDEYRRTVTLDDLRKDRDNLLNNARFSELLRGINGYVWRIEEGGRGGGLHMHVVIFYDGQRHGDIYLAQCIGEYWETVITGGRGKCWNSNARKGNIAYKAWGDATGQIDRENVSKRESLRSVLCYLAKDDQHVSSQGNTRCRMFGTSQFPA